jgi:hypothetical protein
MDTESELDGYNTTTAVCAYYSLGNGNFFWSNSETYVTI